MTYIKIFLTLNLCLFVKNVHIAKTFISDTCMLLPDLCCPEVVWPCRCNHNITMIISKYGGLITFLRLCPGISVVLTIVGVDELGGPIYAPISWLSLFNHRIVIEQYVLEHSFKCCSLITLTTCQLCLALQLNFARHSSPFYIRIFVLSYWSSCANKVRIGHHLFIFHNVNCMKYVNQE